MDTLIELVRALLTPLIVVGGVTSLFLWWRTGFWAPRFIHVIAIFSGLLGLLLAWIAYSSDHPMKERYTWLVVTFSTLVYLAFGFYGRQVIERHLLEKEEANKDREA